MFGKATLAHDVSKSFRTVLRNILEASLSQNLFGSQEQTTYRKTNLKADKGLGGFSASRRFRFAPMSLQLLFDFILVSLFICISLRFKLRFHFGLTSISLRFHFDFTLVTSVTSSSLGLTSISLRFYIGFMPISLRSHFDFSSITHRSHVGSTSV